MSFNCCKCQKYQKYTDWDCCDRYLKSQKKKTTTTNTLKTKKFETITSNQLISGTVFPKEQNTTSHYNQMWKNNTIPQPTGIIPYKKNPLKPNHQIIFSNNEYEDEVDSWFSKTSSPTPPPTPPPVTTTTQYTPTYTLYTTTGTEMIDSQTTVSQSHPNVTSQDPDGINWIDPIHWSNSTWDGTPLNTSGKTKEEICEWISPSTPYVIKGLRERFYEVNPFADNFNPTIPEIDNWNIEVIRHFRNLFGITIPVQNNSRLYLEARWASERKYTEVWDTTYGVNNNFGDAWGPCFNPPGTPIDIASGHCGEAFFPSTDDRNLYISTAPYYNNFTTYPELESYNNRYAQASGLSGANADVPWSIKLAFVIRAWICTEGLSGHPGPYVNPIDAREEFGCAWWYESGSWANFRGKWR